MKRLIRLGIAGFCLTALVGCQTPRVLNSETAIVKDQGIPSNEWTAKLNMQLGNIKDQKTSEEAIDTFVNYFATRTQLASANTTAQVTQSLSTGATRNSFSIEDLKQRMHVQQLATAELQMRAGTPVPILQSQSALPATHLTMPEDMAAFFRSAGEADVSKQVVEEARDAVRRAMPNIAPDATNPNMGPLESSVVAYVIKTGDDGTAPTGSIAIDWARSGLNAQSVTSQSGKAQFLGIDDIFVWGFFAYLAVDMHQQIWTDKDIFGNPVGEYEWRIFSVGCGHERRRVQRKSYYGLNDLERILTDISPYVEFDNSSLPSNALASIGIRTAALSAQMSAAFEQGPEWWTQYQSQLQKGDIVFSRGNELKHKLIASVSSWTHAAMVYDTGRNAVLEATLSGVNINNISTWKPAISWSVKRVNVRSSSEISGAVETAKTRWLGTQYWPKIDKTTADDKTWFRVWADKRETSSMMCFKLVWNTFMLIGVDLDSNRTLLKDNIPGSYMYAAPDRRDDVSTNSRCFIGVTGDDIYASKYLGSDIYSYGLSNLSKPIFAQ